MAAWQVSKGTEDSNDLDPDLYDEGYEVYLPLIPIRVLEEPRCEKTGLRGFRPGPTQTRLYNHKDG